MANNPYVNKVEFGNQTIIDLTSDTVTAADVRQGVLFHLPSGASGIGTAVNGYTIYMTTTSPEFYGQTITVSQNGSVIGTTSFDNHGNAQYSVDNVGTYTVSVTASGTTVSEEVVVSQIEIELEAGFQYKRWIGLTDLNPDDYASLAAVLADEKAVRQLMTVHASVDYLASFTADDASVVTILNDDICAKWITCTAYAEDTLTAAYYALMESIGKYGYGEWALMGQVPPMTSNIAPYGEASLYHPLSSGHATAAYKAFDGLNDGSDYAQIGNATNSDVGRFIYKFTTPTDVCSVVMCDKAWAYDANLIGSIQYSDDGTTWTDTGYTLDLKNTLQTITFLNMGKHLYWGVHFNEGKWLASSYNVYSVTVSYLQFYAYAPKGNVPIMTANNTPYGEVVSNYLGTNTYKAFDGNASTNGDASSNIPSGSSGRIGYKFTTPVAVKRVLLYLNSTSAVTRTIKVQYSDDGSTWQDVYSGTYTFGDRTYYEIQDTSYHLYWGILETHTGSAWRAFASIIQFYGRQMSVSVPKMTSNIAPYGEASANAEYSANMAAWKAFMNDPAITKEWSPAGVTGTTPNTGWIKYDFGSKVKLGFVLIFTRSVNSWTGSIEGYDGEDWETIHTISTPQTGNNYPSISTSHIYVAPVVTEKAYTAFRFTSTSYRVGGTTGNYNEPSVNMVQFFGFDYSEKEWDTEHPRHYIYDHGVELEAITTSGSVTKNPNCLTLASQNAQASVTLDTTLYNLLRAFVGAHASGTNTLICGAGTATFIAANMPYAQGLDVSNVNGDSATGVKQTSAGVFDCEAVWLE